MPDSFDTALGMIETRGLIAAIEAADVMVKTADVRIVSVEQTVAALITIHIFGETAAVQAAVDAGRAAADRVGEVLSAHVIPRPDDDVRAMILKDAGVLGRAASNTQPRRISRKAPASVRDSAAPGDEARDLEQMTVRELRSLARDIPGLPIQGREIARASKQQLIALLRKHR